jgi:hypothetical protein
LLSNLFSYLSEEFYYKMANNGNGQGKIGQIVQIIGPVVDVEFSNNYLPPIYQALRVTSDGFDVETPVDVCEVQQHLGEGRVRAVSMLPTDGMVRGMKVIDQGGRSRSGRRSDSGTRDERHRRSGGRTRSG